MNRLIGCALVAAAMLAGSPAMAQPLSSGEIMQNMQGAWTPEKPEKGNPRACDKAPVKIILRYGGSTITFENVPVGSRSVFTKGDVGPIYNPAGKLIKDDPQMLRLNQRPAHKGDPRMVQLLSMPSKDKIFWTSWIDMKPGQVFVRCPPPKG